MIFLKRTVRHDVTVLQGVERRSYMFHHDQSKTGYGKLVEKTPLYLRCLVEHEEQERFEAAQVLLDKLWQAYRSHEPVDERFLRSIEQNVDTLREAVQKLRIAIRGGPHN